MPARDLRPYSSWTIAAFALWSLTGAMFGFTFSDRHLAGLGGLLTFLLAGAALISGLLFFPIFLHDWVRPPPLAKPEAGAASGGSLLVVEAADDPMREALGWIPKLHLHASSRRAMLASFAFISAWWTVDLLAPEAASFKRLVLAGGVLIPPAFVVYEALRNR